MSPKKIDRLLMTLARRGAQVCKVNRPDSAAERFVVPPQGTLDDRAAIEFGEPVSPATIEAAIKAGYLVANARGRLVLSATGREQVRRLRIAMASTEAVTTGRPMPQEPGNHATASAAPCQSQRDAIAAQAQSPIAWLRLRKNKDGSPLISDAEFAAGERLRIDFLKAVEAPQMTSHWGERTGGGHDRSAHHSAFVDRIDRAVAAQQRLQCALETLDPQIAELIVDVCCYGMGLEQVERAHQLPKRSSKVTLGIGLRALASHYGLASTQPRPRVSIKDGRIVISTTNKSAQRLARQGNI